MAQIAPGQGAPNEYFRIRFLNAYYRNNFNNLTGAATTSVAKFGATGLNQEFTDPANTSGTRYALVKPNLNTTIPDNDLDIFQVYPLIYGTYKGGVTTYGYPIMDTLGCTSALDQSCQFQIFDKNYALFGYNPALFAGSLFVTRDPYFTKWNTLGGILRFGAANTAETAVTSFVSNAAATVQTFTSGAIYNITSGVLNGRLYAVRSPIYATYAANNAHAGYLGYPAGEELVLANGNYRQSFEGGAIEYDPTTQATFLRPGIRTVTLTGDHTAPAQLKVGDTFSATVQVTAVTGDVLTDRTVNWISSNGRVMSVVSTGYTGSFKAVGAGTANITAVVDGKASPALQFIVTGVCCQIGEGAPTAAMQQIFRDAVTRNKLNLQVPGPSPVVRAGNGYYQEVFAADSTRYMLAVPDQSVTAWIMTGPVLSRYLELGGFSGSLGYPTADPTPGGRQMFSGGALAGNPAQLVSAPILAKWAFLGYETGILGAPTGVPADFQTFTAATGTVQTFAKGNIYSMLSGGDSGHSFAVSGTILSKYSSLGAYLGRLGAPMSDEVKRDNRNYQDFEGGTLDYATGDTDANVVFKPRKPAVDATPAAVTAGSRVHLRISGFEDNSTLRVSITGQPDFVVSAASGAYTWDAYFPPNSPAGIIIVRAATSDGKSSASTSFTVRSAFEAKIQVSVTDGNNQVAGPGAILPRPLKVTVRDSARIPIAGVPVTFEPSPGAQIVSASTATDANGEAQATVRTPPVAGALLVNVRIPSDTAVFQALVSGTTIQSFPKLMQSGTAVIGDGSGTLENQGAMLTATASVLRYYQNRGLLPTPLGSADPGLLNQYLTTTCATDPQGNSLCDGYVTPSPGSPDRIVNLWRVGGFAGANLDVLTAAPDLGFAREGIGLGRPVLLGLTLSMDGVPAGSHWVVGIGVGDDGNIAIHDPSPLLARAFISDYIGGFNSDGHDYKAALTSVIQLVPRATPLSGFVVFSNNVPMAASSVQGACSGSLAMPSGAAVPGSMPSYPLTTVRALYCDGQADFYQLDSSSRDPYHMTLTDLSPGGSRMDLSAGGDAAFKVVKSGSQWSTSPADVSFTPASVVNAATFQPGLSPGGLGAIFGTGLARVGSKTQVDIGGLPAAVIASSPFQLNVQVPPQALPGPQSLTINSPYGTLRQTVEIRKTAPGIFMLSVQQGAVVNQDNSINSAFSPIARGQVVVIYCTGLGAVLKQGAYQVAAAPTVVVLQGRELQPAYAGLTPGFIGLYQVNATIPADLPPGLDVPLFLRQDSAASNTVAVSIR